MGKGKPQITNAIRTLRFHAGEMTQAALAEKVGVTRQTIVAIEQGRYSPSLEVAFRIAAAVGLPITEVFQWGTESATAEGRGYESNVNP